MKPGMVPIHRTGAQPVQWQACIFAYQIARPEHSVDWDRRLVALTVRHSTPTSLFPLFFSSYNWDCVALEPLPVFLKTAVVDVVLRTGQRAIGDQNVSVWKTTLQKYHSTASTALHLRLRNASGLVRQSGGSEFSVFTFLRLGMKMVQWNKCMMC